jgi:hypothetical protein
MLEQFSLNNQVDAVTVILVIVVELAVDHTGWECCTRRMGHCSL